MLTNALMLKGFSISAALMLKFSISAALMLNSRPFFRGRRENYACRRKLSRLPGRARGRRLRIGFRPNGFRGRRENYACRRKLSRLRGRARRNG